MSDDIRLYRTILPVDSIERASAFFGSVFDTPGERVSPGRHYFNCGGTLLACYSPDDDGDRPTERWHFHENQYLYFAVADLETYRERIVAAGGTLLSDIASMPWGETLFYALDDQGSRLCFVDNTTLFIGSLGD
ncbi:MAG: VOC family protein [Pseudomonadota bacterium]